MFTKTERELLKLLRKQWKFSIKAEKAKPGSRRQTRLADKSTRFNEQYVNLFFEYYKTYDIRKVPMDFRIQRERVVDHYLAKMR